MLGIAMMVAGVAAFSVMDAVMKWLTADFPVAQVITLRSWFGLPLLLLLVRLEGGRTSLRTNRPLVHAGRFVLVLTMSFAFFWGLARMKLVDAVALSFAAPILVTALSVPILKEPVGWRRWAAIGTGFFGVVIILRPGLGVFQWAALVVLGAALAYAVLMVTTRAFKNTETLASLIFYPQLGMSVTGLFVAPLVWVPPDPADLGLFALAGTIGSIGILCLTHAVRLAPVATVSPFEYTALIWATLLGFMFWRELPDVVTVVGAMVVAASGIYIIYRETAKAGTAKRLRSGRVDAGG